jgi:hypothetical protein
MRQQLLFGLGLVALLAALGESSSESIVSLRGGLFSSGEVATWVAAGRLATAALVALGGLWLMLAAQSLRSSTSQRALLRVRNAGLVLALLVCARVSFGAPWSAVTGLLAMTAMTVAWLSYDYDLEDGKDAEPYPSA